MNFNLIRFSFLYLFFYFSFVPLSSLNGMASEAGLSRFATESSRGEESDQSVRIDPESDQGWRLRYFPRIKGFLSCFDSFREIHESMRQKGNMALESACATHCDHNGTKRRRNVALVCLSLLTQEGEAIGLYGDTNSLVFLSGCYRGEKKSLHDTYYSIVEGFRSADFKKNAIIQALPISKKRLTDWLRLSTETRIEGRLGMEPPRAYVENALLKMKEAALLVDRIDDKADAEELESSLKSVKRMFDQLEVDFAHSEQLLMQYFNSAESQWRIERDVGQLPEEKIIAGIVMHLYTQLLPCRNCAPMLFRECEREHGFAQSLQQTIAARQRQKKPFFVLLVSFSEWLKDSWRGIDEESKNETTELDPNSGAFPYPVIALNPELHRSILQESEGDGAAQSA